MRMILEPVEYRPTKLKMGFMLLFSLLVVAISALMLLDPKTTSEDRVYAVGGTVLFGLGVALGVYSLIRPRAVLRLGPDRIEAISFLGKRTLDFPLSQLAGTRVVRRGRSSFLALLPLDPDAELPDAYPKKGRGDKLTRAMFGSRFLVSPSTYSVRPKRLAEAIEANRAALVRKEGDYPRPVGPAR